jgi:hypothetical protein
VLTRCSKLARLLCDRPVSLLKNSSGGSRHVLTSVWDTLPGVHTVTVATMSNDCAQRVMWGFGIGGGLGASIGGIRHAGRAHAAASAGGVLCSCVDTPVLLRAH